LLGWSGTALINNKWDSKRGNLNYLKPNEYYTKPIIIKTELTREDGTKYVSNQQNSYTLEKGPKLFPICQLCHKDLNEMRNIEKKVVKFCCKSHSIEYSKRNSIRKKTLGDQNTILMWINSGEKPIRTDIVGRVLSGDKYEQVKLKFKKIK
jgi:hypothetical protein